jgi:hypothetical protein
MNTQEKILETLYNLGFKCDMSKYLDLDFEEKVFYLSKKSGSTKFIAEVCPDGLVNGMPLASFLDML